jgi:hypothetical protein
MKLNPIETHGPVQINIETTLNKTSKQAVRVTGTKVNEQLPKEWQYQVHQNSQIHTHMFKQKTHVQSNAKNAISMFLAEPNPWLETAQPIADIFEPHESKDLSL